MDTRPHDFSPHMSFWRHIADGSICSFLEDFNYVGKLIYIRLIIVIVTSKWRMGSSIQGLLSASHLWWLLSRRCTSISQRNESLIEMDKYSHLIWRQNDAWGLSSWGCKSNSQPKGNLLELDIIPFLMWGLISWECISILNVMKILFKWTNVSICRDVKMT